MERAAAALARRALDAAAGPLRERTAALVRRALAALPPPPNTTIVVGHDDCQGERRATVKPGDRYHQDLDLFVFRRVMEPWEEIWKRRALQFHDKDLVDMVQFLPRREPERPKDETGVITRILKNHPGPIGYFRVDSSACPGSDLLEEWVELLSAKGVKHLVFFNITRPTDTIFPLERLRCGSFLRNLAIGFFRLPAAPGVDWCKEASGLQDLNLTGCLFLARSLSAVVRRLPSLETLTLACCNITAGCHGDEDPASGLVLVSYSLNSLKLRECTGSAITIECAPRLASLTSGIVPAPDNNGQNRSSARVLIDFRYAHALREINDLAPHLHRFRISESKSSVTVKRRKVLSLPLVDTLGIGIKMAIPGEAPELMFILHSFPNLTDLTIWRVDDISLHGDINSLHWRFAAPVPACVLDSLEQLVMKNYRGGRAEVALVGSLLSVAKKVETVVLEIDPNTKLSPADAEAAFASYPRVSSKKVEVFCV